MSLVVLRNDPGGDASTFTCHFDEPLILSEKSEVQLVSTVFDSQALFEITAANKTCSYRLKKTGAFVNVIIAEGLYTVDQMRDVLERAFNKVVPDNGASIHVTIKYNADNLFNGYNYRFETGFKKSPPSYQFDSSVISETELTVGTKLEFIDVGVDGWDNKHAFSSEAFTRGKGFYQGRFPYAANSACICLSVAPLEDGNDDTSPYMSVGITPAGALQYTVAGAQTIVPAGTWNPSDDDIYRFYRENGHINVEASSDGGVTFTTIYSNTADDIPMVLFPGAISYTKDNDIDRILQTPDGNTYDSTDQVGTRAPDDPYFKANPADGATLHDDGLGTIKRSGGGSIITFNPGTLAETLGFPSGDIDSPVTRTYTFTNQIPLDPRAEHPALIISLPQLQLRSRNGANSQTGSILGVLPRLTTIPNGNMVYEPRLSLPVRVSFLRETPVSTITCEIRQVDGTPASLRGVSVVTIWVS